MYVVTYRGQFGFIKPWTAVRDGETSTQQFLTPSIIEGMEIGWGAYPINEVADRLPLLEERLRLELAKSDESEQ